MSVNIDTILDTGYDVHVDVTHFDPANTQCNNFLFWRTYQWLKWKLNWDSNPVLFQRYSQQGEWAAPGY